jgi:hypothetical protein
MEANFDLKVKPDAKSTRTRGRRELLDSSRRGREVDAAIGRLRALLEDTVEPGP